ncbi:unnamed protein product [Enterobius vermicularis]|uniref:glucuronosyltransferase n=1 Tax=Enterobius vermicularis TaxID=51028 RepID=A0A0N4VB79_ENTVE|nr:unnamed protein product [Enterobius vermicularis]
MVTVRVILTIAVINLLDTDAAKVLFHAMHSSPSHVGSMLPVAKALCKAGHEVHFLETTYSKKPFRFPDCIQGHFISLPKNITDHHFDDPASRVWTGKPALDTVSNVFHLGDVALQEILVHKQVEINQILNTTWDLVFTDELFSYTSYGIALENARKHQKPFIIFSTTILMHGFGWEQALGNHFLGYYTPWCERFFLFNALGKFCVQFPGGNQFISISSAKQLFRCFVNTQKSCRFIFVSGENEFGTLPENVKVLKWAPQYDVLQHPKTRLFISHCGLKRCFSRFANKHTVTPEGLLNITLDMLNNPKYAEAVAKTYSFYIDRPVESLYEAVFWTNRALQNRSRNLRFKRRGIFMPLMQYFYVVEMLLLLVFIVAVA